jgi:hypothetical protein
MERASRFTRMFTTTSGLAAAALACLGLVQACTGVITDPAAASPGADRPAPAGPQGGAQTAPMGTGGSPAVDPPPVTPPDRCQDLALPAGPSPLRRLTRFEYNNTVRDLLSDATSPADALPAEELANGFGNDASAQSVSSLLAEQYFRVAEAIAARATRTPAALAALAPCAAAVAAANEEACTRTIIQGFVPRAFRRPLGSDEAEPLIGLYRTIRALPGATFATAVAAVLEAVLESPDFLYRVEHGVPDGSRPGLARPSGDEMATRLSYLLWATTPDEGLRAAARTGELLTSEGVLAQASRMLGDPRARRVVRFFFDNLLPINALSDLERDSALYPTFNPEIGALMHEETQRVLEHEIFENDGTWASSLTAPYTFVNQALAAYYKLPAVQGASFQKVPLATSQRLGILTHAGVMAGTTHSNQTNPVVRGSFIAQRLLCIDIPLPSAAIAERVKAPEPYTGKTARERYTKHRSDPVCSGCHAAMDPIGLALENYDAVGLYRTEENGVTIDASGAVPDTEGTVNGPVELVRKIATAEAAQSCFASHWVEFGYGRTLGAGDECLQASLNTAFQKAGYNVRQLLLALTQTRDFLSYVAQQEDLP